MLKALLSFVNRLTDEERLMLARILNIKGYTMLIACNEGEHHICDGTLRSMKGKMLQACACNCHFTREQAVIALGGTDHVDPQ